MILSTNTIYPLSGALQVGINFQMSAPATATCRWPAGTVMLWHRPALRGPRERRYYLYQDDYIAYMSERWPVQEGDQVLRSSLKALDRNWIAEPAPSAPAGAQISLFV